MKKCLFIIVVFLSQFAHAQSDSSNISKLEAIVYSETTEKSLLVQLYPESKNLQKGEKEKFEIEMEKEALAIALTCLNYRKAKNDAFKKAGKVYTLADLVVDANYTKGVGSDKNTEYYSEKADPLKKRIVKEAVALALSGKGGKVAEELNGAAYWNSNNLFRLYPNHYFSKNGFELGKPAHGSLYKNVKNYKKISTQKATDPNRSKKRSYTYLSTYTAGGSIFFKLHPEAIAQGITW